MCFFIPYLVRKQFEPSTFVCERLFFVLFFALLLNYFLPQVYKDSDIDIFTFGTPINTVSLFTILLHLSIEIKAWVSPKLMDICYNHCGILRVSQNSSAILLVFSHTCSVLR